MGERRIGRSKVLLGAIERVQSWRCISVGELCRHRGGQFDNMMDDLRPITQSHRNKSVQGSAGLIGSAGTVRSFLLLPRYNWIYAQQWLYLSPPNIFLNFAGVKIKNGFFLRKYMVKRNTSAINLDGSLSPNLSWLRKPQTIVQVTDGASGGHPPELPNSSFSRKCTSRDIISTGSHI